MVTEQQPPKQHQNGQMSGNGQANDGGDDDGADHNIKLKADFSFNSKRDKQEAVKTFKAHTAVTELFTALLEVKELSVLLAGRNDKVEAIRSMADLMSKPLDQYYEIEPFKQKVNVYFTIQTSSSLADIKNTYQVRSLLESADIYLHPIEIAKEKDTTNIGFIFFVHQEATFIPDYEARTKKTWEELTKLTKEDLNQKIKKYSNRDTVDTTKPFPQLSLKRRPVKHSWLNPVTKLKEHIVTTGLHVTTRKEDAEWLKQVLLVVTRDNMRNMGYFSPWTAAKVSPDSIWKLCKAQETWQNNTGSIAIAGIHPEIMHALRIDAPTDEEKQLSPFTTMLNLAGGSEAKPKILCIEESRKSANKGVWLIVAAKCYFEFLYNWFDCNLEKICLETTKHKKEEFKLETFNRARRMDEKAFQKPDKDTEQVAEEIVAAFSTTDDAKQAPTPQTETRRMPGRGQIIVVDKQPPGQLPPSHRFWSQTHTPQNTITTPQATINTTTPLGMPQYGAMYNQAYGQMTPRTQTMQTTTDAHIKRQVEIQVKAKLERDRIGEDNFRRSITQRMDKLEAGGRAQATTAQQQKETLNDLAEEVQTNHSEMEHQQQLLVKRVTTVEERVDKAEGHIEDIPDMKRGIDLLLMKFNIALPTKKSQQTTQEPQPETERTRQTPTRSNSKKRKPANSPQRTYKDTNNPFSALKNWGDEGSDSEADEVEDKEGKEAIEAPSQDKQQDTMEVEGKEAIEAPSQDEQQDKMEVDLGTQTKDQSTKGTVDKEELVQGDTTNVSFTTDTTNDQVNTDKKTL